ncbi:DNA-binding protein HU [Candidatus Poribacteria bacterium]|nr:DNA-binding protein HU [Candidatus Poribacteria bacterium]
MANQRLTKQDIVNAVAEQAELSRKDAGSALDAVCDAITEALASGDSVGIVGFGTFEVKQRQARTGRNPKTGAELQIPAKNVPSFRAGKKLKDGVN